MSKPKTRYSCLIATVLAGLIESAAGQAFLSDDPGAWVPGVRTEYSVDLNRARSQHVSIEMTLSGLDGGDVDLRLPVWRPGRYEVLDPAGTITSLQATDGSGRPLPVRKLDKSTWRVDPRGVEEISVSYEVYANSLSTRTRHADDTHAFLSGSAVFLYTDEHRNDPVRVRLIAPEGWHAVSGLARDPTTDAYIAPDYDVLVDSPIEVGEHAYVGFAVDGTPHEIVIWGPAEPDLDRLAKDFAAIVRVHRDIFEGEGGPLPYQRYVFLIHSQPGIGGGTEHLNSTIMQTRPASFTSERAYAGFLGLVSHEMFHTWNVKRLRPAGITPYDYQRENYTDLLWVAEGTTSYYDDVTLVRAGLLDPDRYMAQMASTIGREMRRPGYAVQSLAASSFDAWIKYNASTPNDINATVSFYTKGALVSLMLDMEIRRRTGNLATLDHVLRDLYLRHPLDAGGFTTQDFLAALRAASGQSFEPFFDSYVSGTDPLPLVAAFEVAGLTLEPLDAEGGSYLGLSMLGDRVRTVRADGPAFDAGVQVEDRLLEVNGKPIDDLDALLANTDPGSTLELRLERREVPRTIAVETAPPPVARWKLGRVDTPTDLQRTVYESWLGQPWPVEKPSEQGPTPPSDP